MTQDCCSGAGCGCNKTSLYIDKDCPNCGRRLRVTGNLQQIKLRLSCPECGYQSQELSMEELREFID
jgi:endogenous inhibitor of DNA gyrase (YacG/DUF329 family)